MWWTRICEDAAQLIEDDLVFSLGGDGRSRELAGVSGVLVENAVRRFMIDI